MDSLRVNLVRTVDSSYDIIFGNDLFPRIAKDLKEMKLGRPAIITDSNVQRLWGYKLQDTFVREGLSPVSFSFEAGEKNKTRETKNKLLDSMTCEGYGRDSVVIALGGGVVGDVAGYLAGTFNRGVPFIQVPTTVLAQADFAIGGKTGVDTPYGKNLEGVFKQPDRVYVDIRTLETLPDRELRSGLAETIKHGIIRDEKFVRWLMENSDKLLARDSEALRYIAEQNCRIKGAVVEIDPNEKGLRRILNYGHTVGHAVEHLSGYKITHGEAVSIGMMVAARISSSLGIWSSADSIVQEQMIERFGLPTRVPANISTADIIAVTLRDKKAKNGKARYSLPNNFGTMEEFSGEYVAYVDTEIVGKAIDATRDPSKERDTLIRQPVEKVDPVFKNQEDAPACDVCGSITVRNGNCYKCFNCGSSLGCS